MPNIKIKKSYFQILYFFVLRFLNALFRLLTLRKSRKFWGVVYDSTTKQPLDPVIVKLVYAHNGEPVQTCVTDLAGRYGFLAQPGKFKILAKKSNYTFPSIRVQGNHDGIFTDVYHGEFFELYKESEVVGPNIPMDSLKADWNQQAKLKVLNTYPFFKLFVKKIANTFFWFGFIYALSYVLIDLYFTFSLKLTAWPEIVVFGYLTLMVLNSILPELRLWGKATDKAGRPLLGAVLELFNPTLGNIVLAKTHVGEDGRFLLRANPGRYSLRLTYKQITIETKVRVRSEGVVNLSLWINENRI